MKSLLTVAALFVAGAIAAVAQPKLEVEGGFTYNWGKVKVPKENTLEATIKMKNVGTDRLVFKEIVPGCGCTKTDPDKMELNPGETTTMKVKLNVSPQQAGKLSKSIRVRTNATDADSLRILMLEADVQRDVAFLPSAYISFTKMAIGTEATGSVDLVNNGTTPLTVTDISGTNGVLVELKGNRTLAPQEKLTIIAHATPKTTGYFNGVVNIKTNHPDHAEMSIPTYGSVPQAAAAATVVPK